MSDAIKMNPLDKQSTSNGAVILDYTEWRRDLFEDMTLEELSHAAMEFQRKKYPEEFAAENRQTEPEA